MYITGDDTDYGIAQGIRSAQSHWGRRQSYVDSFGISTASENAHTVWRGCYDGAESENCEIFQSTLRLS